jgi:hypothetical protein
LFFNQKWQVFWLSPIGGGLPVPDIDAGTVAMVAANMKGLQLRVQLRTSCL